jgi:hypothetical protein
MNVNDDDVCDFGCIEETKVLLYQHDEMMKNLFKKYLQKHKIFFNIATTFKDLLKIFKVRYFNKQNFSIVKRIQGLLH